MPTNLTGLLVMEYGRIGDLLVMQGRNDLAEEAYKKAIASEERRMPRTARLRSLRSAF